MKRKMKTPWMKTTIIKIIDNIHTSKNIAENRDIFLFYFPTLHI